MPPLVAAKCAKGIFVIKGGLGVGRVGGPEVKKGAFSGG